MRTAWVPLRRVFRATPSWTIVAEEAQSELDGIVRIYTWRKFQGKEVMCRYCDPTWEQASWRAAALGLAILDSEFCFSAFLREHGVKP